MTLLSLLQRDVGRTLCLPAHGRGQALPAPLSRLLRRRPGHWDLAELPSAVMGLDWQTNPELARKRAPGRVFQGNLDPTLLYADPKHIEGKVKEMLAGFGASSQAHIANLGHGVYPDTPLDGVRAFIGTVQAGY